MENLEKDKKINEKILEILLKNTALQGNFMIQCNSVIKAVCPKDSDINIWENFFRSVKIEAAIILMPK